MCLLHSYTNQHFCMKIRTFIHQNSELNPQNIRYLFLKDFILKNLCYELEDYFLSKTEELHVSFASSDCSFPILKALHGLIKYVPGISCKIKVNIQC